MGFIPEEIIDQIRQRADIIDIAGSFLQLTKRGGDHWACCPFHKEKTPSFKLNEQHQGYYCFGCKAHGGVIDFVKEMVNTDFPGAIRWLADRYGIVIPETSGSSSSPDEAARLRKQRERRQQLLNDVAKWYHSLLGYPAAELARRYLDSRGLDREAIDHFGLGYSLDASDGVIQWATKLGYDLEDLVETGLVYRKKENPDKGRDFFRGRLMFPICNELGKVVGFSARYLEPKPNEGKYVNTRETDFFHKNQILYGLHFARASFKEFGYALVVEGQLDVIACHRAGLTNAIASQGTAFTEQHAKILKKSVSNVVLSFDADTAGYKAAEKTMTLLHALDMHVSIVTFPADEDPDSVFRKGGAETLKQIVSVTEPAIPYLFRVACLQSDLETPEGKSIIVNRVLDAIAPMHDEIVKVGHCQWLAEKMNLPESVIINALHSKSQALVHRENDAPVMAPVQHRVPAFSMSSLNNQNWVLLLDLILHFQQYAKDLMYMQDILEVIPSDPVGQAINQVIVLATQDEWETAADVITKLDIFQDPMVGKCVMASECGNSLPSEPNETNRRAFEDCLAKIRIQTISETIQKKQAELSQVLEHERKNALMKEISQLILQKNQLKK